MQGKNCKTFSIVGDGRLEQVLLLFPCLLSPIKDMILIRNSKL